MLAFACAFTMFAGAASFTDEADISENNRDAVELLTTLKIIKGYEDGSFDPEGTVDRAEMAKMIYTIRNGGNDDASAHVGNTTSFTDISGHWAEGYIKYLQNTGIVAGKSATQFAPDAQVTTAEAMKMALALAGYDEKNAGLTGIDWQKNTLTYATTIGLTDDVNSAMSAGCSRQDAAQILANVLEATAVRYSAIVENFVNDSKTGLSYGGDPITVGNKWMDLTIYVGRLTSSGDLTVAGSAAGKDRFTVDVETVDGVDADKVNFNNNPWWWRDNLITCKDGKDHTDLVGMEVKVLTGDKEDEVYGVYATSTSNVVEVSMDQVDVQSDNKVKVDDVTYDTKAANVYVDLGLDSDGHALVADTFDEVFGDDGRVAADTVKIIDWDDDGKYETILVNTVTVAKVNSVTSSSITVGDTGSRDKTIFGNTHTVDFDGNDIYEDVAKGDYVAITKDRYDDSWNVAKVESVEGTVNGLVKNDRRIRVEGEWYTLANTKDDANLDDMDDVFVVPGGRDTFTNGDQIVMYTIGSVVYFADSSTGNDANRSVLMVYDSKTGVGGWNSDDEAKVIFADGDKETINVVAIDGDAPQSNVHGGAITNIDIGRMYRYTVNNDDEYSLFSMNEDMEGNDIAGYDEYIDNSNGDVDGNKVKGKAIADDAVVFALIDNGDDAAVYTGKTVKDADQDNWPAIAYGGVLVDDSNGIDYARMFNIELNTELDDTTLYAYLLEDAIRSKDDAQYIEYRLWTGEEVIEVREKTNVERENDLLAGDVITYNNDGEGMIKDVKEIADRQNGGVEAAIVGYYNDDLRLAGLRGVETYEVDSDTIAIYVDSDKSGDAQGVSGDGFDYIAKGVDNADTGWYYTNVIYTVDNDDNTIKFILIDLSGDLNGNGHEVKDDKASAINVANTITNAALQAALDDRNSVTVDGNYTIDDEIIVPAGVTLTIDGALTLTGTVNGDITVDTIARGSTGTYNGGTMTIKNSQTITNLDTLTVAEGSKLVLEADSTGVPTKFYEGSATQAVKMTTVPAGDYVFEDSIGLVAGGAGASGWLKEVALGGKIDINGAVTSDVALSKLFKVYDEVIATDSANAVVNIPEDKTLTLTAGTATNVEQLQGAGTLKLNASVIGITASKWFFGEALDATADSFVDTNATSMVVGEYKYNTAKRGWQLTTPYGKDLAVKCSSLTQQRLDNALYAVGDNIVEINTDTLNVNLVVPAGKTIRIDSTATINGIITGEGTVIVNKDMSLANIATNNIIVTAAMDQTNLRDAKGGSYVQTIDLRVGTSNNYNAAGTKTKFFRMAGFEYDGTAAVAKGIYNWDATANGFVLQ